MCHADRHLILIKLQFLLDLKEHLLWTQQAQKCAPHLPVLVVCGESQKRLLLVYGESQKWVLLGLDLQLGQGAVCLLL